MKFQSTPQENKIVLGFFIGIIAIFGFRYLQDDSIKAENKELGCDCARILDVPTFKVSEYGSPLPIEHMSNEDYEKYEFCINRFGGPAGANLACGGK